jgi:MipA family protein
MKRRTGDGWILAAALAWACWGAAARAGTVGVRLENPPATGAVVALLFDEPDAFADLRDPVLALRLPPGEASSGEFKGLAPGRYAVMVFHDENGNGELDQNFMGIPREPLGFSRRYWGKGAPVFAEAAVEVPEGGAVPVEVELKSVFGRRGLIGVGVGVIAKSSPYKGADSLDWLAIPAITYIGERVQILGPAGQVGLLSGPKLRLAATARFHMGAYEEEDSDFLEGMGDRKATLMAGLALQAPLAWGVRASLGYEHDVLDRVGGGLGRLTLRRGFQAGRWSVVPALAVNWLTAELALHEYGVESGEAREGRPAYRPGDSIGVEPGLGLSAEWWGAWRILFNASVEFLSGDLRDSPLVDESTVRRFFLALNYTF